MIALLGLAFVPLKANAADLIFPMFQDADIVILGEVHDNPVHHTNQAEIVEALKPAALVFEMFGPTAALAATPSIRADQDALEDALDWRDSGWPDFEMYYQIIAAAPEAALFGGALPGEVVREAIGTGAAQIFGGGAALFGLDQSLPDDELALRVQLQQDAHCGGLPEELLPGMVEAQRLRDAALARATVAAVAHARAVQANGQVVVITGNGHAREDWGVPALLQTYFKDEPDTQIRTLAQFETSLPDLRPYTQSIVTEPVARDDPCRAFQK